METRNPVESYFGSEFLAICIIVELWRLEVARRWKFSRNFRVFLEQWSLMMKC